MTESPKSRRLFGVWKAGITPLCLPLARVEVQGGVDSRFHGNYENKSFQTCCEIIIFNYNTVKG
jgi:hypothetical protein